MRTFMQCRETVYLLEINGGLQTGIEIIVPHSHHSPRTETFWSNIIFQLK